MSNDQIVTYVPGVFQHLTIRRIFLLPKLLQTGKTTRKHRASDRKLNLFYSFFIF